MTRESDNKREFYVIQFIQLLPFESIADYVCVPYTWLILSDETHDKVVVAYPNDEDPSDTRDRVKRKERRNDKWGYYMATIKHKSDSFNAAELWIAKRNNSGPLVKKESKVTNKQPKLPFNKKLCSAYQSHLSKSNDNFRKPLPTSIKRPANTETRKEIDAKGLKQDKPAPSSSAVVNDAKVVARSQKIKQVVIVQDNQSMDFSQTEESSVASNADEITQSRSKIQRTEQTEQAVRSPVTNIDSRTQIINIDDENHSPHVKKPDHNNSMSQAYSSSNTTDVSMTATKPSTSAKQSTRPNQYNHQEYIPDRCSLSNFQPQIDNVRSLANVDDHKQPVNEVPSRKLPISYKGWRDRRSILIQKQVEKILFQMKMERNLAIGAQNPSNSIDQTRQLSTRSVQQPLVVTHNQSQNDSRVIGTHTENSRDQTAPLRSIGMTSQLIQQDILRGFTESNTYDHRPTSETIIMRTPSVRQNPTHLSNPTYQTPELARQRQMQKPNKVNSQQRPKSGISIKPKDRKRKSSFQGVTKTPPLTSAISTNLLKTILQILSTNHNDCLVNNPQLDARMSPRSTGDNNVDFTTSPQNIIASETGDRQNTEIPIRPIYLPSRIQHTTVTDHEEISDRPTADQNSTTTIHQTHSKFILEQQMLDNFAKMGSVLRYTTDMYNTLRSIMLDTAETYKKSSVEQFNTAGSTASSASSSSNLIHEGPRSPEATHSKVTASASSSNQDQHRNNVANKTPENSKLYRFVLPPEYDADDTRWTLKYRKNMPGLVELMPQSGVYVSSGYLNYCQQVSKDCKSLASRLLTEVFNRNALSICSSMNEKAQPYNNIESNIRPDLDDHACSVLLNLVLEHGLQRGWNTDLEPILRILHSKMLEFRCRYGVMYEVIDRK
ncbi:uncharacterized protein LOC125048614 isoform X3 [Pieris napi]|nr:uncharacterized protein LOC125048614 isoform X3 [Pieris napi]